jgi:precorrin-2 methylase
MGDKLILLDVYDFVPPVIKKQNPGISQEEFNRIFGEKRKGIADAIKAELKKEKNVVIPDYGDPTIWSGSEYISENFDSDMFEIIPGLSSFNVASALLNRQTGYKDSIVLTTSMGILDNIFSLQIAI